MSGFPDPVPDHPSGMEVSAGDSHLYTEIPLQVVVQVLGFSEPVEDPMCGRDAAGVQEGSDPQEPQDLPPELGRGPQGRL